MKDKYKDKTATGQSFGEVMHYIGKQTTEQVKKSKKNYSRKQKHTNGDRPGEWDNWCPDFPLFI